MSGRVAGRVRSVTAVAALTVVLLVSGCSGEPPPSTEEHIQAELLSSAAAWLGRYDAVQLPTVVYVVEEIATAYRGFEGDEVEPMVGGDVLARAGDPLFSGAMERVTKDALRSVLGVDRELRFVSTEEAATDRNAQDHLGCYPYLDHAALVSFGAPRQLRQDGAAGYVLALYFSRDCQGASFLLEMGRVDGGWDVTNVVPGGFWIV